MQVLTPIGYVDINDLNIGDEVVAYDINTGAEIINHLEGKTLWTPEMFPAEYTAGYYDEDGNYVDPVLISTSQDIFKRVHGDWITYRINDTWNLYKDQSVWANMNVVHAKDLQLGDIIYNDQDGDIVITSIEEVDTPLLWWKLDVSGDSSYIADGLTLHNASRYWVGGGSSTNWNATANTNWSATSGGANNASVPTSVDAANFDGLGNSDSVISASITILSLTITSGYTATMTNNAVVIIANTGNITIAASYTITGAGSFTMNNNSILDLNGTLINAFTFDGLVRLASNASCNSFTTQGGATLNKTTAETLTVFNSIVITNNGLSGTAEVICKGGTISTGGNAFMGCPFTFDGNITIVGAIFYYKGSYLKYLSGTNNASSTQLNATSISSFDVSGMTWGSFALPDGFTPQTLVSNLNIIGATSVTFACNINTSTSSKLITAGLLLSASIGGTAAVELSGGIWRGNFAVNNPFIFNGSSAISGSVQYGGSLITYTSGSVTSSAANLTFTNSTQTFTINAGSNMLVPMTFIGGTKTLLGNFSVGGLVSVNTTTTVNKTTTETFTLNGGLNCLNNISLVGTTKLIASGGDFSTFVGGGLGMDMDIAGSITISNNLSFGGTSKILKYVSGTITGPGQIWITATTCTLDLDGVIVPKIVFGGTSTLASNLTCNLVESSGGATINKTTTQTLTSNGNITIGNNGIGGTAEIIAKSGSISTGSNSFIGNPLTLDGNLTFVGNVLWHNTSIAGNTIKYLSGTNNSSTTDLKINGQSSIDTSGISWGVLTINIGFSGTLTLISNLNVVGATTVTNIGNINTSTSAKLITGGLILSVAVGGTATIELSGGAWRGNFAVNNPFAFNGSSAISGSVQYGGSLITYTSGSVTSSAANLTFTNSTQTLALSGSNINCPMTFAGGTKTLSTNFDSNGLVTISGATTVNSQSFNINGGVAVNSTLAGTSVVTLKGGTWSGTNTTGISAPLNIDGNVTISGNVYYGTGTISYTSGTPVVTGSTLNTSANTTFNTGAMMWGNVSINLGALHTLTSDLNIGGLLYSNVGGGTFINTSVGASLVLWGGITIDNIFQGTATIVAKSGTFTVSGQTIRNNFNVDGNITIGTFFRYNGGVFTYISGSVTTSGSTFQAAACTLNTKGIIWNNFLSLDFITLTSDVTVQGTLSNANGTTINKTTNETLTVYGGVNVTNFPIAGTAPIILKGGTLTAGNLTNQYLQGPVIIDGNVTFGTNASVALGTLTYRSGIMSGSLNVLNNQNFVDFHKGAVPRVIITTGATVTMNEFFTGTPTKPAVISASTALGQYTVTFTDSFEKIGKNVVVTGCVPSRPLQLILPYTTRTSAIKTTNRGIRYTNQSPNSISKNSNITPQITPVGLLVSDPNFKTP